MSNWVERKTGNSLAVSLTVTVVLIFIVEQGSLWVWFLFTQKDVHVKHLMDKVHSISGIVLDVSVDSMKSSDFRQVQSYIDRLVQDDDIVSIKVLDKAQHAVAMASVPVDHEEKDLPFLFPELNTYEREIVDNGEVVGALKLIYSGIQSCQAV